MNPVLFSSYFPNIHYLSKFFVYYNLIIDLYESYPKQTYRNRTLISSANGVLQLSVPVKTKNHTLTKDVEIDYSTPWQNNHFRAIMSAYRNAPYYDYYIDIFKFVFENKEKYLIDLNNEILIKLLAILYIDNDKLSFSTSYMKNESNLDDFRDIIHPKKDISIDSNFDASKTYIQVFSDRFDFIANLSILDLLFNNGPESFEFIKSCVNPLQK